MQDLKAEDARSFQPAEKQQVSAATNKEANRKTIRDAVCIGLNIA